MKTPYRHIRMTAQRKLILEEIRRLQTHPNADEVFRLVRRRLPSISLGTVYRNLEFLAAHGAIRCLTPVPDARRRYDGDLTPHYHAHCVQCGRVIDLPTDVTLPTPELPHLPGRFLLTGCRVDVEGLCGTCRQRQPRPPRRRPTPSKRS